MTFLLNTPLMVQIQTSSSGFFKNLSAQKWGDIAQAALDTVLMLAGSLP